MIQRLRFFGLAIAIIGVVDLRTKTLSSWREIPKVQPAMINPEVDSGLFSP